MRLALMLLVAIPALAADGRHDDRPFDKVVRRVENHFAARRTEIPFLGLATFFSHAARPVGAKGLKLAIFENVVTEGRGEFSPGIDSSWRPLVRVHSRGRDDVYVYARPEGSWTRLLMLTVDRREAVLVEMSLKPDRLGEFISRWRR